jgi:hypothetical protein
MNCETPTETIENDARLYTGTPSEGSHRLTGGNLVAVGELLGILGELQRVDHFGDLAIHHLFQII